MSALRNGGKLSLAALMVLGGCSSESSGGAQSGGAPSHGGASTTGNGGTNAASGGTPSSSGGTPASGGQSASGGSAGTAASSGGSSSGGSTSGGAQATGGRAEGGANTTSGGASGSSSAGAAGSASAGATGTAGGSATAVPSAGCGKSGRPSGGTVTVANDHIYDFPASYDGTKPFPLLIGFHAAGNPIDHIKTLIKGSAFETNYVRAYGKSAGNEWVYNTDLSKVTKIYDELMSTYCIDKSRVFATGHSSGAQMIVQILTHSDAAQHFAFKSVAPVAASNYGAIVSPIPVMYIQGKMDNVRNSNGSDVVARFTSVNKCSSTTMPYSSVMSCSSTQNGAKVTPGCVSYQSCMQPTVWCSHDDPNYSSTNHGWPCFANTAIYEFFGGLP